MPMFEREKLETYANLIVKKGVNVQPEQPVFITIPVEVADFARILTKSAYEAGASEVYVHWVDDELSLLKFTYASDEVLENFPQWEVAKREEIGRASCRERV